MKKPPNDSTLAPVVAIAWCIVVVAAYYAFNHIYYLNKIETFVRFFTGLHP